MRDEDCANRIIQRIVREADVPLLMEVLAEQISATDLQSLLLAVYKRRASKLSPSAVLKQYMENRFVRPAIVRPQDFIEFERLAFSLLPDGFETIELSPLSPLGSCSVFAGVDQNNTLATIRNTEVCADSTNILALEYAARRKQTRDHSKLHDVKLCASQRLVRGQQFKGPGSVQHFRVFSLCTGGRDRGDCRFEVDALQEHIGFYIRLLKESARFGFRIETTRVTVTPFENGRSQVIKDSVLQPLASQHAEVQFEFDAQRQTGHAYYIWAGFQIFATDSQKQEWFLVDGGFTDWTAKLLSSKKERLLISGMGSDRFLGFFGKS